MSRDRTNIAELLADERCSQAVLAFLANTDDGRTSGPPVAGEEDRSFGVGGGGGEVGGDEGGG